MKPHLLSEWSQLACGSNKLLDSDGRILLVCNRRGVERADLTRGDRKQLVGLETEDPKVVLPDGAHDAELFIKPDELRQKLEANDFAVGRIEGLGPTGLNRRGDFTFGRLPTTLVLYVGSARLIAEAQ